MSIVTKAGDGGMTALMYGRRVPKTHPRVEAYGAVDELNAALGMARATAGEKDLGTTLLEIQQVLVTLMGELATAREDAARYAKDGYPRLGAEATARLEAMVKDLEAQDISMKGWATPGANLSAATLDVARTVCRRAERKVCALGPDEVGNPEVIKFLNRLADLLWLLARRAEDRGEKDAMGSHLNF